MPIQSHWEQFLIEVRQSPSQFSNCESGPVQDLLPSASKTGRHPSVLLQDSQGHLYVALQALVLAFCKARPIRTIQDFSKEAI